MTDRKKPGVPFWTTVTIAGLVLYVRSFGPACWITSWCGIQGGWLFVGYAPLIWMMDNGPDFLLSALSWYSLIGAPDSCGWQIDDSGHFIAFGRFR